MASSSSSTSSNSGQSSTIPSIGATISSSSVEDESKQLWQYVTKNQILNEGGRNISWQCNFCHCLKKSSYTKARAHLLGLGGYGIGVCSKVTSQDKANMQRLEDEMQDRMAKKTPRNIPLPPSFVPSVGKSPCPSIFEQKKRKSAPSAIERSFNMASRDQLHSIIARMFYSSRLPFHLARNPY